MNSNSDMQELNYTTLLALHQKVRSPGAFAITLPKNLFKEEKLRNRNVWGRKGKEPLEMESVGVLKTTLHFFFFFFGGGGGGGDVQRGINGIISHLRKYVNARN